MKAQEVWEDPQEIEDCEENALICRVKLIVSRPHAELVEAGLVAHEDEEEGELKARFVGMGNELCNKCLKALRDLPREDYWGPTSSPDDARFVHTQAAMWERVEETSGLDLRLHPSAPWRRNFLLPYS